MLEVLKKIKNMMDFYEVEKEDIELIFLGVEKELNIDNIYEQVFFSSFFNSDTNLELIKHLDEYLEKLIDIKRLEDEVSHLVKSEYLRIEREIFEREEILADLYKDMKKLEDIITN